VVFDEFRVVVQPDLTNPPNWTIHVESAPRAMLKGPQPSLVPQVVRTDLDFLRNPTNGQDLQALQSLGARVLGSIMPQATLLGLKVCLDDAQLAGRGLRIVVAMRGDSGGGQIGCRELPIEAMFSQQLHFPALSVNTPVSRGVTFAPDRPAVKVAPPLRVLVVASEPTDMPPVNAAAEMAGLTAALQPLTSVGAVELVECKPPTLEQLAAEVQRRIYHVVHFIGHGDFEIGGADPTPQPHLYFENGTPARTRRPADAGQLYIALRNGNVPLVVLTACSSAASLPNGTEYPGLAFEGLAQALVEHVSGPLAAVGMQFDFETNAAAIFSGALYQRLLNRGVTIDQAMASARAALVQQFGTGHRAWVNPTLYWRCINGLAFELLDTGGTLTPQQEQELRVLDSTIQSYVEMLSDLKRQPPDIWQATAALRADWQTKVKQLEQQKGQVLGESVRLRGGDITNAHQVECSLTIQLRSGAAIGDVTATIEYDVNDFTFLQVSAAAGIDPAAVLMQIAGPGKIRVMVRNASQNNPWAAGEHALATVQFSVAANMTKPVVQIKLSSVEVYKSGAVDTGFRALDARVFGR
jgi:hypothetical protein